MLRLTPVIPATGSTTQERNMATRRTMSAGGGATVPMRLADRSFCTDRPRPSPGT